VDGTAGTGSISVLLRQYFPVQDATQVDTTNSCGVVPIAQGSSEVWRFFAT